MDDLQCASLGRDLRDVYEKMIAAPSRTCADLDRVAEIIELLGNCAAKASVIGKHAWEIRLLNIAAVLRSQCGFSYPFVRGSKVPLAPFRA